MPPLSHRDQNDCEQIAVLKRERVNLILDMIKILTDLPLAVHFGSQFNGRPGAFNGKMSDFSLFISSLSHILTLRLHARTCAGHAYVHILAWIDVSGQPNSRVASVCSDLIICMSCVFRCAVRGSLVW